MPVERFLLISIDCWRYDALSRTNPLLNTPKFDLLTQDYALAERFFVPAPATRPSHTSLFTGLYPFEHGLYGQTYLKMFAGIDNLFQLFADAGYQVVGRSQRADVFRFLDFEPFIKTCDDQVSDQHLGALDKVITDLTGDGPRFSFLHLWHTHGGYGLGGIPNPPNLRALVEAGRTDEALRYYFAAAVHVQEYIITEVLKHINLEEWAVFIFGDHGEGFSTEIMAHGDNLHQNVIRVPLLAHIPGHPLCLPTAPLSNIDLFPTIAALAGLETDYRGYGYSLLEPDRIPDQRWVLTELDSLYGVGFLNSGNLKLAHDRVTSRVGVDGQARPQDPAGTQMWTVSDGETFYREDEKTGAVTLRRLDGFELDCPDPQTYRQIRTDLIKHSAYQNLAEQAATNEESQILEQRLRDLGYIE